jgi:hypothetical protein
MMMMMMNDADEKVAQYILREFRREDPTKHLTLCPDTDVVEADAEQGTYGCRTGCDFTRFTALIACSHGDRETYEYGEFGDLSSILFDLEYG